jgi:hypothetical protein
LLVDFWHLGGPKNRTEIKYNETGTMRLFATYLGGAGGQDIRRGMWAQMPYSVSDGQGVINEEFINFVSNRNTYPDKPVSGLPFLTDRFHECVNNIKETLQFVENKKQFYGNLLELQNYLIRRGFYERDSLLSEEYQTNKEIPPVEKYTLDDENYANKLAEAVARKLNLSFKMILEFTAFIFKSLNFSSSSFLFV